jgi:hypothetical protein
MKTPTAAEMAEFRDLTRFDLQEINKQLALSPHLSSFLKKTWSAAVEAIINKMGADHKIDNAAYHLFRIFRDEAGLIHEIEDGLALIERLARDERKLVSFRETPLRLPTESMDQINQIESAIFEILILRGLTRACSSTGVKMELYPKVGSGKSNVEARLWIDGRWCNIEAKALGYTKNMPGTNGARVGTINIDAMAAPITRALKEKAASGKQLACVGTGESAVVFLALKGFLDRRTALATAHDFLVGKPTPLSSVLIFGSAFCRTKPDLVACTMTRTPLTKAESDFLEAIHDHMGFSKVDYLRAANRILTVAKANLSACGARPQKNLRERVVLFLTTKAVTTFESILMLEELDRGLDAQILARSLLEAYAKARYIRINAYPEATAKEFIDYSANRTAKVFNRAEKSGDAFFKDFLDRTDPKRTVRANATKTKYWPENVTDVFLKVTDRGLNLGLSVARYSIPSAP